MLLALVSQWGADLAHPGHARLQQPKNSVTWRSWLSSLLDCWVLPSCPLSWQVFMDLSPRCEPGLSVEGRLPILISVSSKGMVSFDLPDSPMKLPPKVSTLKAHLEVLRSRCGRDCSLAAFSNAMAGDNVLQPVFCQWVHHLATTLEQNLLEVESATKARAGGHSAVDAKGTCQSQARGGKTLQKWLHAKVQEVEHSTCQVLGKYFYKSRELLGNDVGH
eukprot:11469274-Heterocapsa_arctica.AAC.1